MRAFDWDLIRGGHYGQRSCEPHPKAEHMAAPTNPAYVKKALANLEPSTHDPNMKNQMPGAKPAPDLDEELDHLQERVPHGVSKVMKKVRGPSAKPYRIPLGIALTVGGVFGFLPLVGFWMVPLGLA